MSELSSVAEVFAQFLEARDRAPDADIEDWCRQQPAVAERLRRMHADWRRLETALGSAGPVPERERYEVRECLARGGMGAVHRVYDHHLRRELALKILRRQDGEGHKGSSDPRSLSRFLDEARITGQLQHPGIPAVHDLGIDAQGNVFFTMPLVRGSTLRDIIAGSHAGDAEWPLQRVLSVLLKVCEAVAFAHAQGVIHRDLKPGNVMVGRFGETYVMDWGLARLLADLAPEQGIVSERARLSALDPPSLLATRNGDVVGTPSYMPPEQARGELHRLGPRSDVYAAGAMLYHAVAGEPPYGTTTSSHRVIEEILRGPPPRLDRMRLRAPVELVAICTRAMAWEPEDRYADMGELAADLRAYLEVRVVRAHGGHAFAAFRKFVRRNRALSLAIAGSFLALAAGTFISLQQASAANSSSALAMDAIDRMLERVASTRLDDVPRAYPVRMELEQDAIALYQKLRELRSSDPEVSVRLARCQAQLGKVKNKLSDGPGCVQALQNAIEQYDALAATMPGRTDLVVGAAAARHDLAVVVADQGDRMRAEELLGRAAQGLAGLPVDLQARLELLSLVHGQLGDLRTLAGRPLEALGEKQAMVALARQVATLDPSVRRQVSLARSLDQLGLATFAQLGAAEAEPHHREAVAILGPLQQADPGHENLRINHGAVLCNLGRCLRKLGRVDEALASWRQGVELWQATIAEHPEVPKFQSALGITLGQIARNEPDEERAADCWQQSLQALRSASVRAPDNMAFRSDWVGSLFDRALFLIEQGRHRQAVAMASDLAASVPGDAKLALQAASFIAFAIKKLRSDQSLTAAERDAAEVAYRAAAIGHLQQAVARGCRDRSRLQTSHLALFQDDPAFRELLAGLPPD